MYPGNAGGKARVKGVLLYSILILGGMIMIFPFFWTLSTAIKPAYEVITRPPSLLPKHPTLDSFVELWRSDLFFRVFLNTAFIAVVSTTVTLFISSLTGFAFAKYRFPGQHILFILILSTMMIPGQVTMIPLFLMMRSLGWLDTYWAIIAPGVASAFGVFMVRQFMTSIPDELIAAARIDGCSELGIYWKIMIPLSQPILIVLGIFSFMWRWNEFLWPLIVLSNPRMYTIQIFLRTAVGQYFTEYNSLMAGIIVSIIPVMIIFFSFQRYIMEGAFLSGLKT